MISDDMAGEVEGFIHVHVLTPSQKNNRPWPSKSVLLEDVQQERSCEAPMPNMQWVYASQRRG